MSGCILSVIDVDGRLGRVCCCQAASPDVYGADAASSHGEEHANEGHGPRPVDLVVVFLIAVAVTQKKTTIMAAKAPLGNPLQAYSLASQTHVTGQAPDTKRKST